jgi:BirA family transcriptional regulator, biotin operon repressor / biotin---[acetyl-CoA-carboxylase] ligase
VAAFIARQERFAVVPSTNDVVRGWLAEGIPEVCVAVADEQTDGRGRDGRRWLAPPGAALLVSLGFRPTWLAPERVWRLAATASLAMAEAAEDVAGLPDGAIRLKWPNDLVIEASGPSASGMPVGTDAIEIRKVAGVLGETDGLGTADPRAVIGLGINGDWAAADFPSDLRPSMTSLREASDDRRTDHAALLAAFLGRLEVRTAALRVGRFDVAAWSGRQVTTGRVVDLVAPDGAVVTIQAVGVDPASGALLLADADRPGLERAVMVGEIRHVRLAPVVAAGV